MSIDDLYRRRSDLYKTIYAREQKIKGLTKTKERLEKEIQDLRDDKDDINKIVKKIDSITPYLGSAKGDIMSAKNTVSSYYFGSETSTWKSSMQGAYNLADSVETSFTSVQKSGNQTIGNIDKEIKNIDHYDDDD